jgi:glycosyltransferase involved in cell wall biosynthesis
MPENEIKLVIIIPAYNEEEHIEQTIRSLPRAIPGVSMVEILVIDDGSRDETANKAAAAGAIVVKHLRNKGLGRALATGIKEALARRADMVVNIDADGQFDPTEIAKLIESLNSGSADFASGNRFLNGRPAHMPLIKYWGNKAMTALINYLTKEKFHDVSCGFRAYSREALLNLNLFGRFTYTQESFIDLAFKRINIAEVPVSVKYFPDRESKIAKNLFVYALKTLSIIIRSIVNYQPLKFFAYPGFIFILLGLIFIGYLLVHKYATGMYSPYKAYGFIGAGLGIFGALLVAVGLFADTIDRIRINQEKILYYEKKRDHKAE